MSGVIDSGYTLEQGLAAVPERWAALVRQAFEALPNGARIVQVKEKWERLRIYWEPAHVGDDTPEDVSFQDLLYELERQSYTPPK